MKKTVLAALIVFLLGLLTFSFLGLIMFAAEGNPPPAEYPNPHRFQTAIYWFELADSRQEVFRILGNPQYDIGKNLRIRMDALNRADFVFMIFYPLFFGFLAHFVFRYSYRKGRNVLLWRLMLYSVVFMSIVMLFGDFSENLQLLELTKYQHVQDVPESTIISLQVFTRVKWVAMFAASAGISLFYFFCFPRLRYLFIALYLSAAIVGLLAVTQASLKGLLEISGNLYGLAWLTSLIHAGLYFFKHRKERRETH